MTLVEPAASTLRDEALDALRGGEVDELMAQPAELQDRELIDKLAWALAYLKKDLARVDDMMEAEYARLRALHSSEMQVLEERHEDLAGPIRNRLSALSDRIKGWHAAVIRDEIDKGVKDKHLSKSLPTGPFTLTSRAGSTVVEVDDNDAVVKWLIAHNYGNCVVTKQTPKKAELKKLMTEVGVAVPGARVVTNERTFDLKPAVEV